MRELWAEESYTLTEKNDILFVKSLNEDLHKYSDRYQFWIDEKNDNENFITLFDYSLAETIFSMRISSGKNFARAYVDGFILGRDTLG